MTIADAAMCELVLMLLPRRAATSAGARGASSRRLLCFESDGPLTEETGAQMYAPIALKCHFGASRAAYAQRTALGTPGTYAEGLLYTTKLMM
jgi:hypothetical protein